MSDLLLDYNGLVRYDGKIKDYIDAGDDVVSQDISDINQDITDINQDITDINQDIAQINQSLSGAISMASRTVTLSVAGWISNAQTVSVTGVTVNNNVIVAPDPSDIDNYSSAGIKCTAQAANTLTFECDTAPTSTIDVNVLILS